MKRLLLAILLVVSAMVITGAAFHQGTAAENPPTVIRAVAPDTYPIIARQAHAGGSVTVEVKVDAIGKVTLAKAIKGHPLLQKAAIAAASQWRFDSGADGRVALLTFTFIPGDGETDKISFLPPYEVEFVSRRIQTMVTP